jgi:hypothetical protein
VSAADVQTILRELEPQFTRAQKELYERFAYVR